MLLLNHLDVALLSASLTIFLNYCIGKLGSDFSPYEIFSFYTIWLSIKRLQSLGLYDQYAKQYQEALSKQKTNASVIEIKNQFKNILYNAADPYFTWERAIGMCSICTGFWVSLIVGLCFYENLVYLLSVVVFSHVLIRIFNKLI